MRATSHHWLSEWEIGWVPLPRDTPRQDQNMRPFSQWENTQLIKQTEFWFVRVGHICVPALELEAKIMTTHSTRHANGMKSGISSTYLLA